MKKIKSASTPSQIKDKVGLGPPPPITIHVIYSGIECDEDIPTVEPPDENPALFLMPDRTSKELPPLNRVPSGRSAH